MTSEQVKSSHSFGVCLGELSCCLFNLYLTKKKHLKFCLATYLFSQVMSQNNTLRLQCSFRHATFFNHLLTPLGNSQFQLNLIFELWKHFLQQVNRYYINFSLYIYTKCEKSLFEVYSSNGACHSKTHSQGLCPIHSSSE